jgi:excisionase family DNA binding protein
MDTSEGMERMLETVVIAQDEELTASEAAHLAGVSDRTVRNWINEGKLAARMEPGGRKIKRSDLVALLVEKGYAPPPMEPVELFAGTDPESLVADEAPIPDDPALPEEPETERMEAAVPVEVLTTLLQPLSEQLAAERQRSDRLQRENLELAGRVGFLQAKLQETEQKLLTTPRAAVQEPADVPEDPEPSISWWKRLLGLR